MRYLLLQVRNPDDPMRRNEIEAFARVLEAPLEAIEVADLLSGRPDRETLDRADMVLLGGSGDYSVAEGGPWMAEALAAMRDLHAMAKPTFASCWGFQAMSVAMGGTCVTDPDRAEVGTIELRVTDAGRRDPVFGELGDTFFAQMGHMDRVDELPRGAVLLASSDRVANQAYRFEGLPIYCTQFHPELNRYDLVSRFEAYPSYVEKATGLTPEAFFATVRETSASEGILRRFAQAVRTR